ncbi:MAG: energy-coupling factor transporter ATPase [Clostridiales Family XIII bacterium]|jgi:energy-coupling factor transport system ATP-binding protein|nr:energy-coupling factor transporter ATPase [Clostridiales Family XIII bacterium]
MADKDIIITIENLCFEYAGDGDPIPALTEVSLEIERGSFTSVIGRNGSGKSTLAKNINALLLPTAGRVVVGGYDTSLEEFVWDIRQMAGMVFQNPDNQLVSAVVEDDVAFGPENLGLPREEIKKRIRDALESVDMYDQRKMAPHLLSGGQKQRIAIAGVAAMKPDIVIFDEPTAMLDPEGRGEVIDIAKKLNAEGITVLLITHFMDETIDGDRIVIVDGGRVRMDGPPREIFRRAEEIRRLGLRLPFPVELARGLGARGLTVPADTDILDSEKLAAAILRAAAGQGEPRSRGEERGDGEHAGGTKGDGSFVPEGAGQMNRPLLSCVVAEHLTHTFNKGLAYETNAVADVSFEIAEGEFVCIIGHTGSGKSTLVQHLNGLLKPTSGKITVGGVDVTAKNASVIEMRKKIGMVFQYPEYQLFDETVYKDIAFGPKNLGLTDEEADVRVKEAMALVDVDFSEYAQRSPFELSGGQKRKVAIAGVVAMRPEVLILDEPTAGLDPRSHEDVLEMVRSIREKTGCTIILVSHNMEDVARLADRVFVMSEGRIVKTGSPADIYADEGFLTGIGLGLPPARTFANRLSERGLALPLNILTMDMLADSIVNCAGTVS